MRAKMRVSSVSPAHGQETINFSAVTGKDPYGPNGESEDNTYARYTPQGSISLVVNNPELLGKYAVGDAYYVDFTKAEG